MLAAEVSSEYLDLATLGLISVRSLAEPGRAWKRGMIQRRQRKEKERSEGWTNAERQKKETPFGPNWMQSISRNAISRLECRETCIHITLRGVGTLRDVCACVHGAQYRAVS